jgi:hypothetical protein
MKFTSEDLIKAMGLSVGDRIKVADKVYTIIKLDDNYFLEDISLTPVLKINHWQSITTLLNQDYEILPRPKRVGELDCFVEIKCNNCPLRMISGCTNSEGVPLYDILKEIQIDSTKNNMFDQEIHDLLKARLDKELKEYEQH